MMTIKIIFNFKYNDNDNKKIFFFMNELNEFLKKKIYNDDADNKF
jgi:hypothetical protein